MTAESDELAQRIAGALVRVLPTAKWDGILAGKVAAVLGNGDAALTAVLTDRLHASRDHLDHGDPGRREQTEEDIYLSWRSLFARLLQDRALQEPAEQILQTLQAAGSGIRRRRRPADEVVIRSRDIVGAVPGNIVLPGYASPGRHAGRDALAEGFRGDSRSRPRVSLDSAPAKNRPTKPGKARGTAWPHLRAPAAVEAGTPFRIQVGLRAAPDRAVHGTGKLDVPTGDFTLGVELIVDGFTVSGDRAFTLDVTADNLYPKRTVTLVAGTDPQFSARRQIGVVFRVGRDMRGYAARDVEVTPVGAQSILAPRAARRAYGSFAVAPGTPRETADLTIVIQQGDAEHGSRFVWSVASPHLKVETPADNTVPPLQSSAERFLGELVTEASSTTDPLDLVTSLEGRGKADIAPLMPAFVKEALRSVARKVAPKRPTVLLLSQDPYIPWELAVLSPPLPGWPAGGSPFLGAQAVIGRWVLTAEPPPAASPPKRVRVKDEVVVAGDYQGVLDWSELESATREAEALRARWPAAHSVEAKLPPVLECLSGAPRADIIHFALHGQFSADDARQGLVLIDKSGKRPVFLKPSHVDAGQLSAAPLVFLNACQVGASRAVLGNYSGMASAFVRAGAAAVIAPLWSVNDQTASEIALDFYQRALDDAQTPAEVLRGYRAGVTRAAIAAGDHTASSTHIAYQFFGHPNLRLAPKKRKEEL